MSRTTVPAPRSSLPGEREDSTPNLRSLEVGGSREPAERAKPVEAPESAGAEVAFELPTPDGAGIFTVRPLLCPGRLSTAPYSVLSGVLGHSG